MVSYADGLANVNLINLKARHLTYNNMVTLTAIRPINQFGEIIFDENDSIIKFKEKPRMKAYINGGFFIMNKKVFDYINIEKNQELEKDILTKLADIGQLGAYKHNSFWETLNTPKDEINLNNIFNDYTYTKNYKKLPWLTI